MRVEGRGERGEGRGERGEGRGERGEGRGERGEGRGERGEGIFSFRLKSRLRISFYWVFISFTSFTAIIFELSIVRVNFFVRVNSFIFQT